MSKKTKAAKVKAARKPKRHAAKRRMGRRPNPLKAGILSNAAMVEVAETLAWGTLGCQILRSLGIKPIDLVVTIQDGLASTVNSDSPDAPGGEKAEE